MVLPAVASIPAVPHPTPSVNMGMTPQTNIQNLPQVIPYNYGYQVPAEKTVSESMSPPEFEIDGYEEALHE